MERISKDEYFMKIAKNTALLSTCLRRQVGAVIVKDNKIISTGYNGSPKGLSHCSNIGCTRDNLHIPSGERQELCRAVHAEQNAIIQASSNDMNGSTIYVTHQPCVTCAKMIINADIKRVVYDEGYPDILSLEMLSEANVEIYKINVTKNQSFIKVSEILKNNNIENNDFMLKTIDKSIIGVDPHDPNISLATKEKIIQECKSNPWYFFREVLMIPEPLCRKTNFKLHRGNLAMMWLFLNNINSFVYLPSVCGYKSMTGSALMVYVLMFDRDSNITISSHANNSRISTMIDLLPNYFTKHSSDIIIARNTSDMSISNTVNNTRINQQLCHLKNGEEYFSVGDVNFLDDIDFVANFKTKYDNTINPASKIYTPICQYHVNISTSIPGNLDNNETKKVFSILQDCLKFDENFYDLNIKDFKSYIAAKSPIRTVLVKMNYLDIGKSVEWFNKMKNVLNEDDISIRRSLLVEHFSNTEYDKLIKED